MSAPNQAPQTTTPHEHVRHLIHGVADAEAAQVKAEAENVVANRAWQRRLNELNAGPEGESEAARHARLMLAHGEQSALPAPKRTLHSLANAPQELSVGPTRNHMLENSLARREAQQTQTSPDDTGRARAIARTVIATVRSGAGKVAAGVHSERAKSAGGAVVRVLGALGSAHVGYSPVGVARDLDASSGVRPGKHRRTGTAQPSNEPAVRQQAAASPEQPQPPRIPAQPSAPAGPEAVQARNQAPEQAPSTNGAPIADFWSREELQDDRLGRGGRASAGKLVSQMQFATEGKLTMAQTAQMKHSGISESDFRASLPQVITEADLSGNQQFALEKAVKAARQYALAELKFTNDRQPEPISPEEAAAYVRGKVVATKAQFLSNLAQARRQVPVRRGYLSSAPGRSRATAGTR